MGRGSKMNKLNEIIMNLGPTPDQQLPWHWLLGWHEIK